MTSIIRLGDLDKTKSGMFSSEPVVSRISCGQIKIQRISYVELELEQDRLSHLMSG